MLTISTDLRYIKHVGLDKKYPGIDKRGKTMSESYQVISTEKQIDALYGDKYVALSNALIQAREKTSLLESKIELLAIYKMNDDMHDVEKVDADGNLYTVHAVTVNANEIRQLIGKSGGSLYSRVEAASLELKQKLYIFRNPGENQFKIDNLYGEVSYDSGKLTIEFNPKTEYLFLDLKDNFTKLKLDIAFKFTTNGGFQLYKLLKSEIYTLGDSADVELTQEEQKTKSKTYSLSELRLQLGYVDLNQPEIKKEGSKKNPDVEKMAQLEKKPKYKRWVDFYNRVIKPGVEELNKISDIYISSVKKECGSHGKVEDITISVQYNLNYALNHQKNKDKNYPKNEKQKKNTLTEDEKLDFYDEVQDFITEPIKTKGAKALAEESGYDIEKIKKAYKIAQAHGNIDDLMAFLLKAIKESWEEKIPLNNNKAPQYRQFSHGKHEESDLEKELLSN